MTNSLIIINEPLSKMFLGKNTTLAYIASCAELGHEIYIYNLPIFGTILPQKNNGFLTAAHLQKADALLLAKKFREENLKIRKLRQLGRYDEMANLKTAKVDEILPQDFANEVKINFDDINFILQRVEPMKSPFPPEGKANLTSALKILKDVFAPHIFNCPLSPDFEELQDKETPQEINRIYKIEIATPTAQFKLDDPDFLNAVDFACAKYRQLFKVKDSAKIVIKPKNSAQSLGVFAVEFNQRGFDLETLKSKRVSEISGVQIYKIQSQNLTEILTLLCFAQRVKDDANYQQKFLGDISADEIFAKAHELYNQEILAQPFLEGIRNGDVRANILKDSQGNFYCAGYTFRSNSCEEISDDFTTCYTAGKAVSKPIEFLSNAEQKSLTGQCEIVIKILNNDLRQKYKNVTEVGADFILVGDEKSVMLGEINHHCPALLPLSEAMENENYDAGLGFAKKAILDWILLEKIW